MVIICVNEEQATVCVRVFIYTTHIILCAAIACDGNVYEESAIPRAKFLPTGQFYLRICQ